MLTVSTLAIISLKESIPFLILDHVISHAKSSELICWVMHCQAVPEFTNFIFINLPVNRNGHQSSKCGKMNTVKNKLAFTKCKNYPHFLHLKYVRALIQDLLYKYLDWCTRCNSIPTILAAFVKSLGRSLEVLVVVFRWLRTEQATKGVYQPSLYEKISPASRSKLHN